MSLRLISRHDDDRRKQAENTVIIDTVIVPAIGADIGNIIPDLLVQHGPDQKGVFSFASGGKLLLLDYSIEPSDLSAVEDPIDHCANALLQALLEEFWLEQTNRTLHIAAHGTGGLVVKRALTIAGRSREYGDISLMCQSVAFFATPHKGSSVLSDPLLAISVRNKLDLHDRLLQSLRHTLSPDSENIRILDYDFAGVARKLQQIYTFLETDYTHFETLANRETGESLTIATQVVDARSAILRLPNEKIIRLSCSHADMLFVSRSSAHLQDITIYHDGLQDLLQMQPSLSRHFEVELMQDIDVDLHVFVDEPTDDGKRPIKVWNYHVSLADFIKLGPTDCLAAAPSKTHTSVSFPATTAIAATRQPFPMPFVVPPPATKDPRRRSVALRPDAVRQEEAEEKAGVPKLSIIAATPPASPPYTPPRTPSASSRASAGSIKDIQANGTSDELLNEASTILEPFSRGHAKTSADEQQYFRLFEEDKKQQEMLKSRLADPNRTRFKWHHFPFSVLRWVPDVMQSLQLSYRDLKLHTTLLLDHNFDGRQNVAAHKGPHSRFMRPGSKYFPHYGSTIGDERSSHLSDLDQLYVFLPYMNWDTYGSLKKRSLLIAERLAESKYSMRKSSRPRLSSVEEKLTWHYMVERSNLPIHHRRTLDQYGYPNLRSTKARDDDQVLYKRTRASRAPASNAAEAPKRPTRRPFLHDKLKDRNAGQPTA